MNRGAWSFWAQGLAVLAALGCPGGWNRAEAASIRIDTLSGRSMPAGKTLVVPVTASSDTGWPVLYSVEASAPLTAQVEQSTTVLKITVATFGEMTFHLFGSRAPRTVHLLSGMATAGYYDGLTFHRVMPGFVIQGGDPSGNGTGGPPFRFEDEFHAELVFSGTGQLAMANSGKDSNGSQFFITFGPQRFLDLNHTIFGQLLRGMDVAERIAAVPANASSRPLTPVVMTRVGLSLNKTDAVLVLKAAPGAAGASTVIVRANDGHGQVASATFDVQVNAESINDPPILGAVPHQVTSVDTPLVMDLPGIDIDGGGLTFAAQLLGTSTNFAGLTVNSNRVTVSPASGYRGPLDLAVGVRQTGATSRGSTANPFDIEVISIGVGTPALRLEPNAIASPDGVVTTNDTLAILHNPDLAELSGSLRVSINWGDGQVSNGTVEGLAAGRFAVRVSHTYARAGRYWIEVEAGDDDGSVSRISPALNVRPALRISSAASRVLVLFPGWAADGYVLESGSLGNWQAEPVGIEPFGFEQRLVVNPGEFMKLFRLRLGSAQDP